mmetsp:Transcript_30157/g.35085  ORF Transcript_30157/g.35085 Transcript_30157/m.35085 type:complete len:356 (-) Transcript_30157:322-1389(-)
MGERKVLNKYIPSDFDPKLVPRGSKPKDDLVPVRMMLPFTIQCSTCSDFMYRGRKFNSKKEAVKGSEGKYLGLQRYRFYIKCTACSRPVTFLTDPENTDYEMESGGTRTYEVHKDKKKVLEEQSDNMSKKEKEDPMKALENRVLASQKEMADLDNLDEIKAMNMRHLKMSKAAAEDVTDLILKTRHEQDDNDTNKSFFEKQHELNEEDEAFIKSIKFGRQSQSQSQSKHAMTITRLSEEQEDEIQMKRKLEQKLMEQQQRDIFHKAHQIATIGSSSTSSSSSSQRQKMSNTIIKVKRKRKIEDSRCEKTNGNTLRQVQKNQKIESSSSSNIDKEDDNDGALGLLGGYGSSSDGSD